MLSCALTVSVCHARANDAGRQATTAKANATHAREDFIAGFSETGSTRHEVNKTLLLANLRRKT